MILVVIALMSAVLAEFWNRNQSPNHWYLGFEDGWKYLLDSNLMSDENLYIFIDI